MLRPPGANRRALSRDCFSSSQCRQGKPVPGHFRDLQTAGSETRGPPVRTDVISSRDSPARSRHSVREERFWLLLRTPQLPPGFAPAHPRPLPLGCGRRGSQALSAVCGGTLGAHSCTVWPKGNSGPRSDGVACCPDRPWQPARDTGRRRQTAWLHNN